MMFFITQKPVKTLTVSISTLALLFMSANTLATINLAKNAETSYQNSTATLSLQNLERERAALIQDLLDPRLDPQSRLQKLGKRQRHLTDMERMVIRDERLLNTQSQHVKNAFSQYEQTFLVHAGAEHKRSAAQQWLSSVNVSNQAVLNTRMISRK